MSLPFQNIYLVGLPGSGKTTVGRALARRLGLEFIDSDREIEERTGVKIPTIFEIEGQEGFRRRESQIIAECVMVKGCVMATGGGAVLRQENRVALRANGFVVYLDVPPQILLERTRHDRNRPLLQVDDPLVKLKELYAERDPLYRETADFSIDGSQLNAQAVLQLLVKEVEKRWKK